MNFFLLVTMFAPLVFSGWPQSGLFNPSVQEVRAAVGDIGHWEDSIGGQIPGLTFAGFDFDNEIRNDGIYTKPNDSTIELDEAGDYLIIATIRGTDNSNGRYNPQGRVALTSGSGTLYTSYNTGYSRDNSENESWVRAVGVVIGASANAQIQIQRRRDTDAPTSGSVPGQSDVQVVRINPTNYGVYAIGGTTDTYAGSAPYGANTPDTVDITAVTAESSTSAIEGNTTTETVTVKGDNKRYLVAWSVSGDTGGVRTQRIGHLEYDGVDDLATRSYCYQRQASDEYCGLGAIDIIETSTADRAIQVEVYIGDGAASDQGGAENTGSWVADGNGQLVILELPDSLEVFRAHDSIGLQDITSAVTLNAARDVDFNDANSFTKASNTAIDVTYPADIFAFGNVWTARNNVGSGLRLTAYGRITINGVEQSVGEHGNYTRGDQSTSGTFGGVFSPAGIFTIGTAGHDIGINMDPLAGTEGGGADRTQAGTVGFFALNLDTLLPPAFEQSAYRFFANTNSADVGSALAVQDSAATLATTGDAFRLRTLIHVSDAPLRPSLQDFKLQFAEKSGTCDTSFTGESYADVTGATVIAFNNNATPADGDNLTANASDPTHGGHTIVNQDYEEANNFTNSVAAIPAGQDGKWDFSLIDNGATANTSYCFRIVEADNTQLSTYTVIPEVITASAGGSPDIAQIHYRWRGDTEGETGTTWAFAEDATSTSLVKQTPTRLRFAISNEGTADTGNIEYQLEVSGANPSSCSVASYQAVTAGGETHWDMATSTNFTNSDPTTNNSGITDENTTFVAGDIMDTSDTTGVIDLTSTQHTQVEFSIEANTSATNGGTYCFRLTNAGSTTNFSYDQYAAATLETLPDVTVSTEGTQVATVDAGSSGNNMGAKFVITDTAGNSPNVTTLVFAENGTIDSVNDISSIFVRAESDTSDPYDCASESYDGTEYSYGPADIDGFNSAGGTASFTDSFSISPTSAMCVYVRLGIGVGASPGETIELQITDPSTDVVVSSGTVGPSTPVLLPGTTVVSGLPDLDQIRYRWLYDNEDENEADVIAAENATNTAVIKNDIQRLRFMVSNEGSGTSGSTTYRLEVSEANPSSCSAGTYERVSTDADWDLGNSLEFSDGAATADSGSYLTNENTTFVAGEQKDTSDTTSGITLTSTEFTEIEYAIKPTTAATDGGNYCFRLTNAGTALDTYTQYAIAAVKSTATNIYRSVGTNQSNLNVAGATITIATSTVTFSTDPTSGSGNIGVGDVIQYQDGGAGQYYLAFITGRTSATEYTVTNYSGGLPHKVAAGETALVYRVYDHAAGWEANTLSQENANIDATVDDYVILPSTNLTDYNYVMKVPLYKDGVDNEYLSLAGWTTSASNYIHLFTPIASSEVGTSQRHTGIAGTGYVYARTGAPGAGTSSHINVTVPFVRIEGIELDGSFFRGGENVNGILFNAAGSSDLRLTNSILHDISGDDCCDEDASLVNAVAVQSSADTVRIANNIIYDISSSSAHASSDVAGIKLSNSAGNVYVYSNTIFDITQTSVSGGDARGIYETSISSYLLKNNYVGGTVASNGSSVESDYVGDFASGSTNNVSSDATAGDDVDQVNEITGQNSYANYFRDVDPGEEDLRLKSNSNTLWGSYGADLDVDGNIAITTDIEGEARDGTNPDIGADEAVNVADLQQLHYRWGTDDGRESWYSSSWQHRVSVNIPGTNLVAPMADFPIYVDLSDLPTAFFETVQTDGDDIRITDGDGVTELPFELVSINTGTQTGELHFKADLFTGTVNNFYIYYGNASATGYATTDTYGAENVWTNGYSGVWHLGETVTDEQTSGVHYDSTSNSLDGSQNNNATLAAGKLGQAQNFDGTSDAITIADNDALTPVGDATYSYWAYLETLNTSNDGVFLYKMHSVAPWYSYIIEFDGNGTDHQIANYLDTNESNNQAGSTATTSAGAWFSVNAVRESDTWKYYLNSAATGWTSALTTDMFNSDGNLVVGAGYGGTQNEIDGYMDELRISSVARTADWIAAEYNNQNTANGFYVVGFHETDWADWGYRTSIIIDADRVTSTLINFPVYVDLSDLPSGFWTNVQADGDDIRITNADGEEMPIELVSITDSGTTGTGELHFKADSLSSLVDTIFYIYYGNASATGYATTNTYGAENVWTDYYAVFHLNENVNTASGGYANSAGGGDGTGTGMAEAAVAGALGGGQAQAFAAGADYISFTETLTSEDTVTMSAWAYPTETQPAYVGILESRTDNFVGLLDSGAGTDMLTTAWNGGAGEYDANTGLTWSQNEWQFFAGVVDDNTTVRTYLNDQFFDVVSASNTRSPALWYIGVDPISAGTRDWRGYLDEVRIAKEVRSADWLQAEYLNQGTPEAFYTVGAHTVVTQTNSWLENEDTLAEITIGDIAHLRLLVSNEGSAPSGDVQYLLQVSEPNPASCATASSWDSVTVDSHWNLADTAFYEDMDNSYDVASGLTNENTAFVKGWIMESSDTSSKVDLTTTEFTELKYSLTPTADATTGATYCFRVIDNGVTTNFTHSVYGQASVAGGAQTISFSISDSTIGFGTLTSAFTRFATGDTLGTTTTSSAHTLTASTNASSGYSIIVEGATLTDGSYTIDAIGGVATTSQSGIEQFGVRYTASGGSGSVASPYNGATTYAYDGVSNADVVASLGAGDGVATIYSAYYIANIADLTEGGTYSTQIQYTITANY